MTENEDKITILQGEGARCFGEDAWACWREKCQVELLWREEDGGLKQAMPEHIEDAPGIYVQERRDGRFYVGLSVDLAQRQRQHLGRSVDVTALGVLRMPGADSAMLQEQETKLVTVATQARIPLANQQKTTKAKVRLENEHRMSSVTGPFSPAVLSAHFGRTWGPAGLPACQAAWAGRTSRSDWEAIERFEGDDAAERIIRLVNRVAVIAVPLEHRYDEYGKRWCVDVMQTSAGETRSGEGAQLVAVRTGVDTLFEVRRHLAGTTGVLYTASIRLATEPLTDGGRWRLLDAQSRFGGAHWIVGEMEELAETYLLALKLFMKEPAMREAACRAGAASRAVWAAGGETFVTVTDSLRAIEAMLENNEVMMALQMHAFARLASGQLDPARSVMIWPWLL